MSIEPKVSEQRLTVAPLPKRANAAIVDMAFVGIWCFGLEWTIRIADPPKWQLAIVFGAVLAVTVVVEMLTGQTAGKLIAGLSVRNPCGDRPTIYTRVIRTLVRWFPVAVFLPSLFIKNGLTSLIIWGVSLTLVCCYVSIAYLTLMRTDKTFFDMAARTVVKGAPIQP
jgi:uncharacterized RDD family membrane protein YckC